MGPIRGECVSLAWSLVTNESNRRVFPAMKRKLGAFGSSLYMYQLVLYCSHCCTQVYFVLVVVMQCRHCYF